MERYLDVTIAGLRALGDEVRVAGRSVAAPDGDALEVPWADEHDPGDPRAGAALRAELGARTYDAVAVHNVLDDEVLAAARTARRVVYHLHDHRPCCPNGDRVYPRTGGRCAETMGMACMRHALTDGCMYGPWPRSLRLLRRRERVRDLIAASDAVFANSLFVAQRAERSGIGGAVPVAPPLDDAAFAAAIAPDASALLFAGRVEPQKGLRSLVRALARIPAAQRPPLRVAGDGPDLPGALALARELGVALDALGVLDARGVRAALDACGALVMPSLWDEPFGMIGIEAFARGRPVVAYDVGGISWWLRDGRNGLLVPAGDERALADALLRVAGTAERARLGAAARDDAEQYRATPLVARMRELYAG